MISWRRILLGRPIATAHAHEERLPKRVALPVYASDAISSVAYATEEIIVTLTAIGVAGMVALSVVFPISIVIALLMAVVVFSYRQTIFAYPNGGGSFMVAKSNLGTIPGLIAGAALMIDYVLTVAVSVAAGVAAIISAFGHLEQYRVPLCVGFVTLLTIANLRGLKESGSTFMFPSYGFMLCAYTLIAVGLLQFATGQLQPYVPVETHGGHPPGGEIETLTVLLVLKAFSSGCAAMSGTEAVSNGVPSFRPPESKNAATTLVIMGCILASLFLGIGFLSWKVGAVPPHDHSETVMSILASQVFGRNWFYYVLQLATCLLLIVAANTAFAGFPRLTMLLAQDRFLPRQLANIGDRLVFSNGIIVLAVFSSILLALFGGITHNLIPLYAVGVFLSFTLSQLGMVKHWFRERTPGWKLSSVINGFGALCTGVVLSIISFTKFTAGEEVHIGPLTTPFGAWAVLTVVTFVLMSMWHRWIGKWVLALSCIGMLIALGVFRLDVFAQMEIRLGAWVVIVLIPAIVWGCFRIHRHYDECKVHLTMEKYRPLKRIRHTVLVSVPGVHRGVMPALEYARSIGGDVRAVYVEIDPAATADVLKRWSRWVPDIPLVVLESPYRSLTGPLLDYVDAVEHERTDDVVTVILPEFVTSKWWTKALHNQTGLLLKWSLLFRKGVVVTNIRYFLEDFDQDLGEHPLVSGVHVEDELDPEPPAKKPLPSDGTTASDVEAGTAPAEEPAKEA